MAKVATIARRTFLIGTAAIAGGLAVGYYYYRRPYPNPLRATSRPGDAIFNPYVKVTSDGTITVIVPRAEMGQGVTTTLAAFVAEEMDVELTGISVEHGPASAAYYNEAMLKEGGPFASFDRGVMAEAGREAFGVVAKFLGLQGTGGSSSTIDAFVKMRQAGAAARHMLVEAAAREWNLPAERLETQRGLVVDPASGRTLSYGTLARKAAEIAAPSSVALKPASQWRLLGKPQRRLDVPAKSTGAAEFGIDVDLPDMLYASVRMNPRLGGSMISFDASQALKMPGIIAAVDLGGGVGVLANNTWRAMRAAEAVTIDWGPAPYPANTDAIFAVIAKAANGSDGFTLRNDGDAATAVAQAAPADRIEAEYRAPFLAHACMEPMNATAQWKNGELNVWAGTQGPTTVQLVAAREFNIKAEKVRVHTKFLGGGFGRRFEIDFCLYAMRLARHSRGRPVKVTWTREEDIRHDTYRPGAVAKLKAVVKDGKPLAIEARIAAPSIMKSLSVRTPGLTAPPGPDKTIVEGFFDQPYKIANYRVSGVAADVAVPVGFWRSVGNSYNGFFHECFIDEIATKAGRDPIELRLELMRDWPTAIQVVEKVAAMSNWAAKPDKGRARGAAFTLSFGSWVGEVVEISLAEGGIRIEKVWCAADVGKAIDRDILVAQMESAIIFGLSAATNQEVTFADGMVEQSNFHDYDALRMHQAPQIEVAILENADRMGGAGEPGTPPAAAALANAVFAATGTRIRELPLSKAVSFVA
jgi:isoquinoline 1-oxidoreductase beta subunit